MHSLGTGVELLVPRDDLPTGIDAKLIGQRNQLVQDLRDAAPETRRVYVNDRLVLQGLCKLPQVINDVFSGNLGVGVQKPRHGVDSSK